MANNRSVGCTGPTGSIGFGASGASGMVGVTGPAVSNYVPIGLTGPTGAIGSTGPYGSEPLRPKIKKNCEKWGCDALANRFLYQAVGEYHYLISTCDLHVSIYTNMQYKKWTEITKDEAYCLEIMVS